MTSGCIDGRWDAVISNTSAPWAASVRPQTGPAMMRVRSRTLTPARGRSAAGMGRRVADLIDGEERKARDRTALRMRVPLGERPARGHHEAGVGGGSLECLAAPSIERALDCRSVMAATEQGKHPVAMVGQIGMEPHPTAVAAAIESRDRVVIFGRRLSIEAQVAFAAEFDRGAAHVDADALAAPRA